MEVIGQALSTITGLLMPRASSNTVAAGRWSNLYDRRSKVPTDGNAAENNKYVEKETSRASRFIADSSPAGNKAGLESNKRRVTNEKNSRVGIHPAYCFSGVPRLTSGGRRSA
jgi:hypothetical protein